MMLTNIPTLLFAITTLITLQRKMLWKNMLKFFKYKMMRLPVNLTNSAKWTSMLDHNLTVAAVSLELECAMSKSSDNHSLELKMLDLDLPREDIEQLP